MRPPVSTRTRAYVRSRAEAAMTGSVRIIRAEPLSLDAATLLVTTVEATEIYAGKARIYTTSGSSALYVGESVTSTSMTTVTIPAAAAQPKVDDVVLVVSFGADPELAGDAYQIKDVGGGGLLRASRSLTCVAYQASRWWER